MWVGALAPRWTAPQITAELGHIIPDSAMSAPHLWIIATFIAMVHFLKSFKKSVVLRFF
jgi:hypothetical protein